MIQTVMDITALQPDTFCKRYKLQYFECWISLTFYERQTKEVQSEFLVCRGDKSCCIHIIYAAWSISEWRKNPQLVWISCELISSSSEATITNQAVKCFMEEVKTKYTKYQLLDYPWLSWPLTCIMRVKIKNRFACASRGCELLVSRDQRYNFPGAQ